MTAQTLAKEAKLKKKKKRTRKLQTVEHNRQKDASVSWKNIWKRAAIITKNKWETCPS